MTIASKLREVTSMLSVRLLLVLSAPIFLLLAIHSVIAQRFEAARA